MKVLILSCNTGQGHNTAGRAVMEEFCRQGVACEMRDALAFSSELTSRVISGAYVRMANDAPEVFGKIYRAGEAISNPRIKSPVYAANMTYTRKLGKYIQQCGFDAVITSHVFPAQALTHLCRHGEIDAKTYFIATDYTCHPFTEEIEPDRYFIGHADLIGEYVSRGIPRDKLCATGIPVSMRFAGHVSKEQARRQLGIPAEKKVILVMTGSMGFGAAAPVVDTILKGGSRYMVYVMTGRNEEMKREIDEIHARDPRAVAVPFTTEVPLYMSAADVLMTKPGGLTTTEAAALNIPLVLSAPIPGCETANAAFFEEKRMAVCVRDMEASAHAALWLAADEEKSRRIIETQAHTINARAAADICDIVMKDVEQRNRIP